MSLLMSLERAASASEAAGADETPRIEIVGDWQVQVSPGTVKQGRKRARISQSVTLDVAPATLLHVQDEKYDSLPIYDANLAPWGRGTKLRQLTTFETTAPDCLVPDTLVLKGGAGQGDALHAGQRLRARNTLGDDGTGRGRHCGGTGCLGQLQTADGVASIRSWSALRGKYASCRERPTTRRRIRLNWREANWQWRTSGSRRCCRS